jgi:ATP adenylyltransferase
MEKRDKTNLILHLGRHTFVMMNKFPYSNGHVMVVPKRHCSDLEPLDDEELQDLIFLLRASTRILRQMLRPDGFNIGMNIGKVGGAGVDGHIHFHIVPRWIGDTNFMPVLGETKIIPEYLEKTYEKLHAAFMDLSHRKRVQKRRREK